MRKVKLKYQHVMDTFFKSLCTNPTLPANIDVTPPPIPNTTKLTLQHSNKYPDLINKNTPAVTIVAAYITITAKCLKSSRDKVQMMSFPVNRVYKLPRVPSNSAFFVESSCVRTKNNSVTLM